MVQKTLLTLEVVKCDFKKNNILFYQGLSESLHSFLISDYHQHFNNKFFVRSLFWQLFSSYMYVEKAAEMMFVQKICM